MIKIKKSETADTRTCDFGSVSKETLRQSSESHIYDVIRGMNFFGDMIKRAGLFHDVTKLNRLNMFHSDFQTGFKVTNWWEMHQMAERHHLRDAKYVPDDVNLVDIIEMITDGVMAGMARSGEYRKEEISDELLRKAFDNTIALLLENIEVDK
jgi:hypothetical protein